MAENKPPLLKVVINGQEREISFEELTLSNNLAQEALVRLLVQKNIISPKELIDNMEQVRKERYRTVNEGKDTGKSS